MVVGEWCGVSLVASSTGDAAVWAQRPSGVCGGELSDRQARMEATRVLVFRRAVDERGADLSR